MASFQHIWEKEATTLQREYANSFKYMDRCTMDVLRNRLAVSLFHIPENIPSDSPTVSLEHFTTGQQEDVKKLALCILQYQKSSNQENIYVHFILVLGRTDDGSNFSEWVYKVPGESNTSKFIDRNCRVYSNWNDFLKSNTLPKATICCPVNGEYDYRGDELEVVLKATPKSDPGHDVLLGFDVVNGIAGIGAAAVTTAALFVPIALPVIWVAFGITVASGAYGAGRSIEHLVDRGQHDETLSLLDPQARSAWLGATVPFLGIAAGGIAAAAASGSLSGMGIAVTDEAILAMNVTNGINCAAHGACFVHDVYNIIESSINDGNVSTLQIFQCIASALLFANAVVSTHQVRMLLQSLPSKQGSGGLGWLDKLSLAKLIENGKYIRPTNFMIHSNISSIIETVVSWGGLTLRIPPNISICIEKIFKYLLTNKKSDFTQMIREITPLINHVWESLTERSYLNPCQSASDMFSLPENKRKSNMLSLVSTNDIVDSEVSHSSIGNDNCEITSQERNNRRRDLESNNKIFICDMEWKGNEELFLNAINEMNPMGNISIFKLLQITQIFYQRITNDVLEKEKHFQNALKRSRMNEREMEHTLGIEGERGQYFADDVMKSYTDFKLFAIKQDCERTIEERGLLVPVYSSDFCPIHVLYYESIQTHESMTQRYLNILRNGNLISEHNYIQFPSHNSFFVKFEGTESKYVMIGILNFGEDDNMKGIIILQRRL